MNNGTYIERIEISSFGKLKNLVLTPTSGINVLTAPNESGKSTLADFIKFVFYGFSGARKNSIAENEKQHYSPWDGSRIAGSVTLVTPDGKFKVERTVSGAKESVEIFDTATRKNVFSGMVPGEVFFGVGEESFEKILYFKQLFRQTNGDGALAEQIQNLIFSADEKTNTERAVKRLKELRASLKNNQKKGKIPDLENKLAEYEAKLTESLEIKQQLDSIVVSLEERKNRIAFNEKKLASLEEEAENIVRYESKKKLDSLTELALKKKEAEDNYNRCMAEFKNDDIPDTEMVQNLISDNTALSLAEKKTGDIESEIKAETKRLETIKESNPFFTNDPEKAKKAVKSAKTLPIILFVIGVLCLCGAAVFMVLDGIGIPFYVLCAAAAVFIVSGLIMSVRKPSVVKKLGLSSKAEVMRMIEEYPLEKAKAGEKEKRIIALESSLSETRLERDALKASIDERIGKYMSVGDTAYGLTIQKMLNNSIEAGSYKAEYISLSEQLEKELGGVDLEKLRADAENASVPEHDIDTVKRQMEFYKSAISATRTQENDLEKQKAALEAKTQSPSVLYGKRDAIKKQLASYRIKYESLGLALEVIEESGDYMKSTISPKIAQLASGYFASATNEKYPEMTLTTDLNMSVSNGKTEKSVEYLSGGAQDTAYMCLRCALIELLYEHKKPFMLLDDAFSRLDDGRLVTMLKELVALSEREQIIILTCHSRERLILEKLTDNVNILELEQ